MSHSKVKKSFKSSIIKIDKIDKINNNKYNNNNNNNNNNKLYIDKLNLNSLCCNPNIQLILPKIIHKIDEYHWFILSRNQNAISFIKNNVNKLTYNNCWSNICDFKSIEAIRLIADNIHLLNNESWEVLCKNEMAISILETHIDYIIKNGFLLELCLNINAIHIIEKYLNLFCENCWANLCLNNNAYLLIKNNLDKLTHIDCWINMCWNNNFNIVNDIIKNNLNKLNNKCWLILCNNFNAITLIKENPGKIDKEYCFELCKNPNPDVCDILKNYITLMDDELDFWHDLTDNYYNNPSPKLLDFIENTYQYNCDCSSFNNIWASPDAMPYIEKNIHKLDTNPDFLYMLSTNKNAIHIIENKLDEFDQHCWERLCTNINAMPIIINNLDKLNQEAWITLSRNPDIINYL